jgi:hypothetical protein
MPPPEALARAADFEERKPVQDEATRMRKDLLRLIRGLLTAGSTVDTLG